MDSVNLLFREPLSRSTAGELLLPRLTEDEIHELETDNLWMMYRVAQVVTVLAGYILCFTALCRRDELAEHWQGMASAAFCLGVCLTSLLITRRWQKQGNISSRRVQILTEFLYWGLSIWGMCASLRHYALGEQMLVFDTVQLGFVLTLTCHPIRALLHILGSYGGFYLLLLRFDHAAQVQGLNYFALACLLITGYLLHFRKQMRVLHLQEAQRSQILDLESASSHDALTGLKNRYALRQDFSGYVGKTVWVIMADIDFFKRYNDTYGHGVGDQLLTAIGETIRQFFGRESSYRYGGDEFLIMVEGEDPSAVCTMLEQWQRAVSELTVETAVERVNPRCSYGMSGGPILSETRLRAHVRRADEKLYEVKARRS